MLMTTTTVQTSAGVETWCDDCGSVAWFRYDDAQSAVKAESAALLHEDNDHAAIWLNDGSWPTVTNTGHYAGGCQYLLEASR